MSTAAQQQANKENAQHSTGPRTDEGKQRSSLNALKHGLYATDPLIRGEDPDDFYKHGADLEFQLRPANAVEEDLVEQIIDITWRLKRCARIESAVINELYDTVAAQPQNHDKDPDQLLGKALAHSDALSRHSRCETRLARRYQGAMKELRELRKQRARSAFFSGLEDAPRPKPQAESSADTDPAPDTNGDAEMTEPTQSVATLLESIAPINPPDREPDPGDLGISDPHPIQPETQRELAHQEAAK
jgi:hypothetical protein